MSKKKKIIIVSTAVFLVLAIVGTSLGLYFGIYRDPNKGKFMEERALYSVALASCDFYDNLNSPLPSVSVYNQMSKHFYENTRGKTPKLLFIGYDGCLATGLASRRNAEDSAVFLIGETGGMYLTRTGGKDPVNKYLQNTSTGPGWAALFTGQWADKNNVRTNGGILSTKTETLFYSLAKNDNLATSFTVSWPSHFKTTYRREIASAKKKGYPITYTLAEGDDGVMEATGERISSSNDSGIFCILEYPDREGHTTGFSMSNEKYVQSVKDVDSQAYKLIQKVYARPTYPSEDWMIVLASDHGGVETHHGGGTIMEYTTFYVSNKKLI